MGARTRTAAKLLTLTLLASACSGGSEQCAPDALGARTQHDLAVFTDWLDQHDVRGVIGEAGWPGEAGWQAVAADWVAAADDADVGVLAWAAAEQWPADYPLALYRASMTDGPLDTAGPSAAVVQREVVDGPALSGVNAAGGSFGADIENGYSAADPGTYGQDYRYPSADSLAFLAERGVKTVRLAVTWERLQGKPFGELVSAELARVQAVLRDAETAGVEVVLDLHSYGRFITGGVGPGAPARELLLGSPELPPEALADLWKRLAEQVSKAPALAGYGLMNEPHDLPGGAATWQRASQLAVEAVRRSDPRTPALVGGYDFSSAARWDTVQDGPWIEDPSGEVVYEAHQYFDDDASGAYGRPYAAELADARAQGWTRCGRE